MPEGYCDEPGDQEFVSPVEYSVRTEAPDHPTNAGHDREREATEVGDS